MRQFKPGQLQTGSLYNISSSYAVTASYSMNGGGTNINTGSFVTTSSFNAFTASYTTGSFTGSFVGTLTGTASYASYANSASYAATASFSLATTENRILVLNQSGLTINKGVVVRITGSNTSSDIPRIITASYTNDSNSANTLGITSQLIANGDQGFVTTEGVLLGVNTSNFYSGQLLYLGDTGSIIGTAPQAPLHAVRLGEVVRVQSNNGSIYVRIDNGYELDELHDVLITSASSGDLFVRSGSVWTNQKQLTGSYALTGSLTATSFTGSLFGTSSWASNAVTSSYLNTLNQNLTFNGNLTLNGTASITFLNVTYESASVIFSSGSNQFGDATNDTQTLIGRTIVSGSLEVTGSANLPSITGSLFGTASWAQNSVTASFITTAQTASYVLNAVSSSFATSASNVPIIIGSTALTSGTSGRLLFQSGSVIQQDSEIFWDTTNKKLGIGKSPAASSAKMVIAINDATGNQNYYLTLRNLGVGYGSWGFAKLDSNDLGINYQTDSDAPLAGTSLRFYYGGNSAFASSLSVGSLTTPSARLDVRAQGALSSDTAFRVRNSGDTANILTVNGDGTQTWFAPGNNALNSIKSGTYNLIQWGNENFGNVAIGYVTGSSNLFTPTNYYNTLIGASTVIDSLTGGAVRVGALGSTAGLSAINIGYSGRVSGSNAIKIGVGVGASNFGGTNSIHIGSTTSGNDIIPDNVFMTYFNSQSPSTLARSNGSFGLLGQQSSILINGTGLYGVDTHMGNGGNTLVVATHPSPPSSSITTAFQLYASTGSLTSNIRPHFRTSNGTIVWLGDESRLFNVTASRTIISSSQNTISGSSLTVYGSGSSLPVFTVQGSQGELFSVTDSLSGSLFSVNDISGLPILEVFSDNTTLIGNYLDPMLITTAKTVQTNSGSFVVYSLPTASYDTAFFEYSVRSGSNARAGTIMAIQSGSAVNFTETTTTDFGNTTAVAFTVIVIGSNMALTGSSTSGAWTTKCIVRGI